MRLSSNIVTLFVTLVILLSISVDIGYACSTTQDTCIAFDESSRMGFYEYMYMVKKVVDQLTKLSKYSKKSTYSAIGYTTKSRVLVHTTKQMSQFSRGVNSISLNLGDTLHSVALQACYKELKNNGNSNNGKTIVIISNGQDLNINQSKKIAMDLKKKGIVIITIAVDGDDVNKKILKTIATNEEWAYKYLKGFYYFSMRKSLLFNSLCDANKYHLEEKDEEEETEDETPIPTIEPEDEEKEEEKEEKKKPKMNFFSLKKTGLQNGYLLSKIFLRFRKLHYPERSKGMKVNVIVVSGIRKRGLQNIGNRKCLTGRRTVCGIRLRITSEMYVKTSGIVKTIRRIIIKRKDFPIVFNTKGIVVKRSSRLSFTVTIIFNSKYVHQVKG